MMSRVLLSLWVLLWAVGPASGQTPTGMSPIAFVHVNVVPMDRERVLEDQTVVVEAGRIIALGPSGRTAVPPGTIRIDARGRYLIPGLAEMHAHIPGGSASDSDIARVLFLYLANGVTTVRGMLGHPRHLDLKRQVAAGRVVGPTIITSGPSLNGQSVPTPDAARRAVAAQREAGYDFLKIHPGIRREVFDTLVAAATEHRMPFAGHVPLDVGLSRALEAGYHSIDHLDGYLEALLEAEAPVAAQDSRFFGLNLAGYLDPSGIDRLAVATRAAGVWNVPTETLIENLVAGATPDGLAERPEMRYVGDDVLAQWRNTTESLRQDVGEMERWRFVEVRRMLIKALHRAGAGLLLGSDAPQVWNVPGFSIHRELELLVTAGLSPYHALETGTINVARFLGAEAEAGTIATGKRADLVLLEGNPLADIGATAEIAGVMFGGRWLDQKAIAERLEALALR